MLYQSRYGSNIFFGSVNNIISSLANFLTIWTIIVCMQNDFAHQKWQFSQKKLFDNFKVKLKIVLSL